MAVSLQLLLKVSCICTVWLSSQAFLVKRYQLLLNGSFGEPDSSYTSFQFQHIYGCGAECAKESSDCWAWSYDYSSSTCHVFPTSSKTILTTGKFTAFRTYSSSTSSTSQSSSYYVPTGRCRTWLDAYNLCRNEGTMMAYEPDPDVVRGILNDLPEDSILIGLERTSDGSGWQDCNGNEISFNSINWQNGQPNNDGGNENKCLSYLGEVADIREGEIFDPKLPVLCSSYS
ncbi:C-type lectin fold [Trinorchestia longiramus]|nr:C-type lectin fold [Trinorchestia longiramus]